MAILCYEFQEKFMPILKLHPVDGDRTYINNKYSESLQNMLQESVLHIIGPNLVLEKCKKIVRKKNYFRRANYHRLIT